MLAFGDEPGMDEPLESTSTSAGGALAATDMASVRPQPSTANIDSAQHRYPSILPSSVPPPSDYNSPYSNPYSSHSAASAFLYGSATNVATNPGPASPAGFGTSYTALRPQPQQYSSAANLTGSVGCALALPVVHPDASASAGGSVGESDLPVRTIGVAGIVKREHQKTAETGR